MTGLIRIVAVSLGFFVTACQVEGGDPSGAVNPPVEQNPAVANPTAPNPTVPVDQKPLGASFFVAPTGDDAAVGSEQKPWRTIQQAARTLKAGETVFVKNGVYSGVYINRSGSAGKPIAFRAFAGDQPKIIITEINSPGFLVQGASYIDIDGFDLDYRVPGVESANGERWEGGITVTVSAKGTAPVLSHHVRISNNRVHGFPGGGIGSGLADYITIEGNTIWETALWSHYDTSAISLYQNVDANLNSGFHNVIRGNTVFKNENRVADRFSKQITDGNCIIIDDNRQTQKKLDDKTQYPAYQSSTLIENNICSNNGGRGVNVYSSDNVLVRHNTFYKNAQTAGIEGELTAVDASNVRFVNNIIYAQAGKRATDTFNATNIIFERNLYFGTNNTPNKNATDLTGDPLFENASGNLLEANFRLRPGSPAIDAALAGQSPTKDVSGSPRPRGAAADIGAWESR